MAKKKSNQREFKITWDSADELPVKYANHFFISFTGDEYFLIFGELSPPIVENITDKDIPSTLKIKPIVKLAIPKGAMITIAKLISKNVILNGESEK